MECSMQSRVLLAWSSIPKLEFALGPMKLKRRDVHLKVDRTENQRKLSLILLSLPDVFNFTCEKVNETVAVSHPRYSDPEDW